MIRNPDQRPKFDEMGVPTVLADLEYPIDHAVRGCDAVIFAAGSGGWTNPRDPRAAAQGMPPVQLYNLRMDPYETTNLQAKYPNVVWRLTRLLEEQIDRGRSTPGKEQSNDVAVDYRKILEDHPGRK